jgi:hypothetical protein
LSQGSFFDSGESSAEAQDEGLQLVLRWLLAHRKWKEDGLGLEGQFARAIRKAIDEVIDGARTGRFLYSQLETQEKTYVGTRIEIVVRTELGLNFGQHLDTEIAGQEVDIKWSAKGSWMIPTEAVGEICLVLCGDEETKTFSVGLVRCTEDRLNTGQNKDKKRTLSRAGREAIKWLIKDGYLPISFLADLDRETRDAILAKPAGQARVRELFIRQPGRIVPRDVIPTLATQVDPMRRIRRDSSDRLGGMKILSGHYEISRKSAALLGFGSLRREDYVSVPLSDLDRLPSELRNELTKSKGEP